MSETSVLYVTEEGLKKLQDEYDNLVHVVREEVKAELAEAHKQLQTELASLLLIGKPASLQMEEGCKSTMPIGQDKLFITRNMDTSSLASTFPFTSAVMTQNKKEILTM